ncbi:hypothetical protein BSZ35_04290 [Salinibacter sp. 10B]|uniref:M1 family metallopeptidase n=1 Tax=Salinibacter sp. 10B TaxID=1923971 RepID=UPI000CF3835B|nr:M1 family metallopeptidase [Salinibacter sp. 10B]PQJ33929.1 hypothetical protein BSZ35_04290 [Salinibacter sp. 10B]
MSFFDTRRLLAIILLLGCSVRPSLSQTQPAPSVSGTAPSPHAIYEDSAFTRAVQRGTRTRSGRPGPHYWQQYAHYTIEATLRPDANRLTGHAQITYLNRSPDTLRRIAVHLRQNLFRPEVAPEASVPSTEGMSLHHVAADGHPLSRSESSADSTYRVDGTVAWLHLPGPLLPSDSVSLSFEWHHTPPPVPADGRQGREGTVFFLGYWYPQVAVYDDVDGWVARPYTGQAEFYMGQADYDVRLTVPPHWLVGATGTLQNPEAVLSARSRRRLARARHTGNVVPILEAGEQGTGAATRPAGPDSMVTWHFSAHSVRDFAWGTSDQYLWHATRALVPPPNSRSWKTPRTPTERPPSTAPDTVLVHSFFRATNAARAWPKGARHTRNAVEVLSAYLQQPYPYPSMTAMEGVLQSGGMEYPRITIMQPWADSLKLAGDLMHEVGHMWIPMEVGTNEKRHVWMDEGMTQFNTAQGMRRLYGPGPRPRGRANDSETGQRTTYLRIARRGYEVPLMRPGDAIPRALYFDLPYDKAAQVFTALRGVVGKESFLRAYRAFYDRWWGKHPQPYDLFNTFADVTGRDLSWFWHTWLYTTATLDQAISSVETQGDSTRITVANRDRAPMPVPLAITRSDGSTERHTIPVNVWLEGANQHTITVPAAPTIERVVIDPEEHFPDLNRTNQQWQR